MFVEWFSAMVLSVFGDESSDRAKERVFAMSGIFGLESEWQPAEKAWTAVTKGEVFHAADWEHAERYEEYEALAAVLATQHIGGVAYAIDLVAFEQVFPNTLRESAYMKCFTYVVKDIATNAERFSATQSQPLTKVEYTFDNRKQSQYSAARIYDSLLSEPHWSAASLLASKVSFECRTNPRIQMADLVAREAMKDLDRRVGPAAFQERRAKIALESSGHFKFFMFGRADFESERIKHAELEKDGINAAAYHEWLRRKNAQDTWDNKVLFVEKLDAERRRRS